MKQLERIKTITYRWWREAGGILPAHVEELDEAANDRIADQMRDGYGRGELCTTLRAGNGKDIEYTGYWEVKEGA